MSKWIAEFELEDGDTMPEHMDLEYKGVRIDFHCKPLEQEPILDRVRAEIITCLKALDDIEKSGLNIYLPNEMAGRRLTYQQCLRFIDKYKAESEVCNGNDN